MSWCNERPPQKKKFNAYRYVTASLATPTGGNKAKFGSANQVTVFALPSKKHVNDNLVCVKCGKVKYTLTVLLLTLHISFKKMTE